MHTFSTDDYVRRFERVSDHVSRHVARRISVHELAQIANLSPYHFHRLFGAVTGETVHEHATRLRLERAAALLRGDPDLEAWAAGLAVGFRSASAFSRAFKARFGVPPGTWDRKSALENRKIEQASMPHAPYALEVLEEFEQSGAMRADVKRLPGLALLCLRVRAPYQGSNLVDGFERLRGWLEERALEPTRLTWVGLSQDDPEVVPRAKCRYDVGVVAPPDLRPLRGAVRLRFVPPMLAATLEVSGGIEAVDRAWQFLYRSWLPRSPYLPGNFPALEVFHRAPMLDGWARFEQRCVLPLEEPFSEEEDG